MNHWSLVDLMEALVTRDTEVERLQHELAANRDEVCRDKLELEINHKYILAIYKRISIKMRPNKYTYLLIQYNTYHP